MKITPIDERLLHAITRINGEVKELLDAVENEEDLVRDEAYVRVVDDSKLLDEYTSCFAHNGEISQRGEIPHIWNKDTIFESHRYPTNDTERQQEFEWESEENNDNNQQE